MALNHLSAYERQKSLRDRIALLESEFGKFQLDGVHFNALNAGLLPIQSGGAIATATYACKDGKNEFAFDFSCSNAGQKLDVYEAGSQTPARPLDGNPVLSGGDVGGFFYNYNAGTGGVASAIIYDYAN